MKEPINLTKYQFYDKKKTEVHCLYHATDPISMGNTNRNHSSETEEEQRNPYCEKRIGGESTKKNQ